MVTITAKFTPRGDISRFAQVVMMLRVSQAVQESCELVQSLEQDRCPIDTGALLASITLDPQTMGDDSITGSVAPHMPYASYVEYGTGMRGDPSAPYGHVMSWPGMAAQPYVRPAVDEAKGQIKDIFLRNLEGPWD
jgi:HK97 gp10 family phage protein